ncbi:MAG: hypothetical protein ACRDPK_12500 [Carbonactinosporaceae bacterium]
MPDRRLGEHARTQPARQRGQTRRGGQDLDIRRDYHIDSSDQGPANDQPDVFLDVPVVKVDEINLEVENLRARVSLQAEVLDLLKLNVGADVELGRVALEITGVEAQALLKVRLDNVEKILERVLTTIDENPQILEHVTRGLETTLQEVGGGAGQAVGELGRGAGEAVEEVGEGAGGAVEGVGEGAGGAVEGVGEGAGGAVQDVGESTGEAASSATSLTPREVVRFVGTTAWHAGKEARDAMTRAAKAARKPE